MLHGVVRNDADGPVVTEWSQDFGNAPRALGAMVWSLAATGSPRRSAASVDEIGDGARGVCLLPRQHVAVRVEGEGDRGVAEAV